MENIIDRIYKIVDYKSISVNEFSKKISVSNGYLAKQKANKANIGSHIVEKIVNFFPEINPTWLITGKGEMILSEDIVELTKKLNPANRSEKETNEREYEKTQKSYSDFYENFVKVNRIADLLDKDRVSDIYDDIVFHCDMIHLCAEHYSLFKKSEELINETDKKILAEKIRKILNLEKELFEIVSPHMKTIIDLFNKLYDFDKKNDRFMCFDEKEKELFGQDINDAINNP